MSVGVILGIDQGTTNTKAVLVDRSGNPLFRASSPVSSIHTQHGFVEQDPLLLWESLLKVIAASKAHADSTGTRIEGIAVSNQRETAFAWHARTGEQLANAISWQCCRSAEICSRLSPQAATVLNKTGLRLAPVVTAGKWTWLLENNTEVRETAARGELRLGTVDSWIIYKLTGGAMHATDFSNASRTGLLNLDTLAWDEELLATFGIPLCAMPELRSSSGAFGLCAAVPQLDKVPVLAAIGDSHAAMFGHGHYTPGTVKATYGTGSSLMTLTSSLIAESPFLARTIAWSIDGQTQFALEGNIAMTGSAVQWVGEFLQLPNPTEDVVSLAATVPDSGGVYIVPAMLGLGAPHWDPDARGTIAGLCRSHTSAHLARAAVDSIAYQIADVFFTMERAAGVRAPELHADGGATRNSVLMQFQADILERPVLRSANEDLSALGAAWLGGLALGWWKTLAELKSLCHRADRFSPELEAGKRERLYREWKNSVRRARLVPEPVA